MPSIQQKKRRIVALAIISLALAWGSNVNSETEIKPKPSKQPTAVVVLTIDYGDGAQKRYPTIPWVKNMTVLSALNWASKHPRGIEIQSRGKGATTLVTKIDDLKNQGGRGENWVFRVNDKLAERSCGVFPLKQGDRILWKFERYQ